VQQFYFVTYCIMLYGYVRVSTDKQTVENQKLSISSYTGTKKLPGEIIRVSETESGTKSYRSRQLGTLVEQLQKGDILVVSELSRLEPSWLHLPPTSWR
jgi:putative DNA-invertase from lambdoid prophage Rac